MKLLLWPPLFMGEQLAPYPLEVIKNINNKICVVLITSDKCYENVETFYGYKETDQLGGKDPYSASKACAEIIANSYIRSFFIFI